MASWTNQSTNSLLPGEPWTSAKALAAFENPVAIAEGASGAPSVYTRSLKPQFDQVLSDTGFADTDTVILSLDAGSVANWVVLVMGTFSLTRADSGDAEIYVQASTDNVNFTNIRTILDDGLATLGSSVSIIYQDIASTTADYRYYRVVATGDGDHPYTANRASLVLLGKTEEIAP